MTCNESKDNESFRHTILEKINANNEDVNTNKVMSI